MLADNNQKNEKIESQLQEKEISLKKNLNEIYYSLEGYFKYKYFIDQKVDEFNSPVELECNKYLKVKRRIYYSAFFWGVFYSFGIIKLFNLVYINPLIRLIIIISIAVPNFSVFLRKMRNNSLEMHKLLIHYYLKENILHNETHESSYDIVNDTLKEKKDSYLFDKNEKEIEMFLKDYSQLALKGDFWNI